jgi:hypothetical protein
MFFVLTSDIPSHFNNKSAILSYLCFIEKKVMLVLHAVLHITAKERCPIHTYEKFKMCKQGCFQNYIQRKAAIGGQPKNLLTDLCSSHLRLYRIEDDFFLKMTLIFVSNIWYFYPCLQTYIQAI